ncbi:MAG: hypothetical protein WAL30_00055 [Candidatus Aquirickettsiella sp.]
MNPRSFISLLTLACAFLFISVSIDAKEAHNYKPTHYLCDCIPIHCVTGNTVNWQCVYKELYLQSCDDSDQCCEITKDNVKSYKSH